MTTQKTPHRWADVLRAIADGEEVQYFCPMHEKWVTPGGHGGVTPIYHHSYQWRIAPKKQTVWVNVYPGYSVGNYYYKTKMQADCGAEIDRIACVPITFTEGEGLE